MRITTLTAMMLLASVASIGPSLPANAQPAPPPSAPPGMAPPGIGHPAMGGMRQRPIDPGLFALMYRPDDRRLTPPDVQKIAEAILLWFGNRTWKVTDVAPEADGKIKFAYATSDGSVIARFTMDTKSGRVVRTG